MVFDIIQHSPLRNLSNQVFLHQIKCYPIFLLAENRQFNEIMVDIIQAALQRYLYSTGTNLT